MTSTASRRTLDAPATPSRAASGPMAVMDTIPRNRLPLLAAVVAGLLWGAALGAQDLPTNPALEAAILVEEVEHDQDSALQRYRELAQDDAQPPGVRRHAWLRVAQLLRQLRPEEERAIAAAFERAIGGVDDTLARRAVELRDLPRPDVERAAALAAEAERLLADRAPGAGFPIDDLVWIGEPALPAVNRVLSRFTVDRRQLFQVLWRVPGSRSAEALRDWFFEPRGMLDDSLDGVLDPWIDSLRGYWVSNIVIDGNLDSEHRAVIGDVIRSAEHAQHARELLRRALWQVPEDALLAAASAEDRDLSAGALSGLSSLLQNRPSEVLLDGAVALLPQQLENADPGIQRAAQILLIVAACRRVDAFELLMERLGELRVSGHVGDVSIAGRYEQLFPLLADAANRADVRSGMPAWDVVFRFMHAFGDAARSTGGQLTRAAARAVCELMVRTDGSLVALVPRGMVPPSMGAEVVEILAGSSVLGSREVLQWIAYRAELSGAPVEPLVQLVDPDERSDLQGCLVAALARMATPRAVEVLRVALAGEYARSLRDYAPSALLELSARRDDDATRALLRDVFAEQAVGQYPATNTYTNPWDRLLARLVQLGDLEVLRRIPMGDDVQSPDGGSLYQSYPGAILPDWAAEDGRLAQIPVGPGWLTFRESGVDDPRVWHGYTDAEYREAWTILLAPQDGAWRPDALAAAGDLVHDDALCAPILRRQVLEAWRARLSGQPEASRMEIDGLRRLFELTTRDDLEPTTREALLAVRELAFARDEPLVRAVAIRGLDPEEPGELERVRRAIGDPDLAVRSAGWDVLRAPRGPLDLATAERIVEVIDSYAREGASHGADNLWWLMDRIDAETAMPFAGLLDNPDQSTRLQAIQVLAAPMDVAVVPVLLKATAHPDPVTRKAAREALDAIRYHVEQTAHWERVFSGTAQLGRSRAAARLVDQAAPEQPVARRLLAIRSLGALGEPEVLPFLVDWAESEDQSVAAAAKAAIEQIVTSAGK